eukprot:sb/3471881/
MEGEEVQHNERDAIVTSCITSLEEDEDALETYSYGLKYVETGETASDIPSSQISRTFVVPSKELIKMFIKFHTTKSSNMYNVSKEMLLKYSIPHKFATVKSVLAAASAKKSGPKTMTTGTAKKSKSLTPNSKGSSSGATKKIKIHSIGEDGKLITTWKEIPNNRGGSLVSWFVSIH